ncbi:hypothetical protein AGR4A_pAt30066 [Agrobacterium tumefaciens str. B6]|uniref:Uncharacterized protein n=1 Tax=Agrobacterium tumefaciens str. B6 TaxID=1183423 RepID=A0A822VCX7_AGRTU|nr:hypothetical protein AGR4A_pAt30066 [Agrobacterium tumefaciens str. B6]
MQIQNDFLSVRTSFDASQSLPGIWWQRIVGRDRLIAPFGSVDSSYVYAVQVFRPGRPKTAHFVKWLQEATEQDSRAD